MLDSSSPPTLLTCHNLTLAPGGEALCRELGFTLLESGLLVIRGANGSGKTSLLKALAGLLSPEEGEIRWRGERIAESESFAEEMLYIGHRLALKEECTVWQNLRFWASLRDTAMLLPAVIRYFNLDNLLGMPCRRLSAGWQRRIALSRLMLNPAALWLLDEPFSNLDSDGIARLAGLIESRLRKGGMVVMSAHGLPPEVAACQPAFLDMMDFY